MRQFRFTCSTLLLALAILASMPFCSVRAADTADVPALLQQLTTGNETERQDSADKLTYIQDDPRVPAGLAAALKSEKNPLVRMHIASALSYSFDAQAVTALIDALHDDYLPVRASAAVALGHSDDERAAKALLTLAKEEQSDIRDKAVLGLGGQFTRLTMNGSPLIKDVLDLLLTATRDKDPLVREQAVRAICESRQVKDDRTFTVLAAVLKDPEPRIRLALVNGIRNIFEPQTADLLAAALKDQDNNVRMNANQNLTTFGFNMSSFGMHQVVDHLLLVSIGLLKDPDAQIRRNGVSLLTTLQSPQKTELLLQWLDDPDPAVRVEVAGLLASTSKDPKIIDVLIALTKDNSVVNRRIAITLLGTIANKRSTETLFSLIDDPQCFDVALTSLAKLGDPRTLDILSKRLEERKTNIQWILFALGEIQDPRAVDLLMRGYKQETDRGNRQAAIMSLAKLHDPRMVDTLLDAMKDGDEIIREHAGEGLLKYQDPRVPNALEDLLLHDKNDFVKSRVTSELSRIRDPRFVKPVMLYMAGCDPRNMMSGFGMSLNYLQRTGAAGMQIFIDDLRDPDPAVRAAAAVALHAFPDARAVPGLIKLLNVPQAETRYQAAATLGLLVDMRAFTPLLRCMKDTEAAVRTEAIRAMGKYGALRVLADLRSAMRDPDADVRLAAVTAIGELLATHSTEATSNQINPNTRQITLDVFDPVTNSINALVPLINDDDPRIPFEVMNALAKIGTSHATEQLLKAMAAKDGLEDWRINSTLNLLKNKQAIPALLQAVTDPNPAIRYEAISAMRNFPDPQVTKAVIHACDDQDQRVLGVAMIALGQVGGKGAADTLALMTNVAPNHNMGAVVALGQLGDTRALPLLLQYLKSTNSNTRYWAIQGLTNLRVPESNEVMAAIVMNDREDNIVRSSAVTALIAQKSPRLVDFLITELKMPRLSGTADDILLNYKDCSDPRLLQPMLDYAERKQEGSQDIGYLADQVAPILGNIGDIRAAEVLRKYLQLDTGIPHVHLATALGQLKDRQAVGTLIAALTRYNAQSYWWDRQNSYYRDQPTLRMTAAEALGRIGDPQAVPPLIALLGSGTMRERNAIAAALGQLKDPRAVTPLINELPNLTGDARTAAAKALQILTGQPFGPDAGKWQAWQANKGKPVGKSTIKHAH